MLSQSIARHRGWIGLTLLFLCTFFVVFEVTPREGQLRQRGLSPQLESDDRQLIFYPTAARLFEQRVLESAWKVHFVDFPVPYPGKDALLEIRVRYPTRPASMGDRLTVTP